MIRWSAAFLLCILTAAPLRAQPASVATTIGDISVVKLYPVIFVGGMGVASSTEFAVGPDGTTVSVPIAAAPVGFRLLDALWQPYENIAALGGFAQIVVAPGNDNGHLLLTAKPYPGAQVRLRLAITVLFVRDPAK